MDTANLRSQLAPQWNAVTLAITVVLFLFKWPLGVAMAAYVIWGQKYGLNLAQPQTFIVAGKRLGRALGRALADFNDDASNRPSQTGLGTGKPDTSYAVGDDAGAGRSQAAADFEQWRRGESERLRVERDALDAEKAAFAKEKAAWEAQQKRHA